MFILILKIFLSTFLFVNIKNFLRLIIIKLVIWIVVKILKLIKIQNIKKLIISKKYKFIKILIFKSNFLNLKTRLVFA